MLRENLSLAESTEDVKKFFVYAVKEFLERALEGQISFEYEDIALKTGQNINTVRVILSRARRMIRDEMKKIYNEPGRNKDTA